MKIIQRKSIRAIYNRKAFLDRQRWREDIYEELTKNIHDKCL